MPRVKIGVVDSMSHPKIDALVGVDLLVVAEPCTRTRWSGAAVVAPASRDSVASYREHGVCVVVGAPTDKLVVAASALPDPVSVVVSDRPAPRVAARDNRLVLSVMPGQMGVVEAVNEPGRVSVTWRELSPAAPKPKSAATPATAANTQDPS